MALTGACEAQGQAPTPIDNNMGRLENELNELHLRLDTLRERLGVILEPSNPRDVEKGAEKTEKGGSSLAMRLLETKESVLRETGVINDILQRLEI